MIGEKLGLRKNELSALQMQPDDKSLRDVLNRWTETRRKPYTWDTFLVALRSSDVDMKEVADNIECKYNMKIHISVKLSRKIKCKRRYHESLQTLLFNAV